MNTSAATNDSRLNIRSKTVFFEQNHVYGQKKGVFVHRSPSPSSPVHDESGGEGLRENNAILKFISQMLMEEDDLENKPWMIHDLLALQTIEKSLYDILNNENLTKTRGSVESNRNSTGDFEHVIIGDGASSQFDPTFFNCECLCHDSDRNSRTTTCDYVVKKYRHREEDDGDILEYRRSNKLLLSDNVCESEPFEMYEYGDLLLCSNPDGLMQTERNKANKSSTEGVGGGVVGGGGKKQDIIVKDLVDLKSLLMQCAQAVADFDIRVVDNLLLRIRLYSSPQGDSMERVAHYLANALEARLAGTGTALHAAADSKRISTADILKAHKVYVRASPFMTMSNLLANRTIGKLADGADVLHIIDFGVLYGFQWPCLILALSERPGGSPKIRITGIDFPRPGFRPAERVVETGRRLARFCERLGVPFEYNAIARGWDDVKVEDIGIGSDEVLVVNSMYRLHNVMDEAETVDSPRDAVLNLIRKINPDVFIHGVINATHSTPFFMRRFREAFFHFSSMFDMFEATVREEDQSMRLLLEECILGKASMSSIACEGTERMERPETYKRWQLRTVRAGFRQLSFDGEIVKLVDKVKRGYHKDFSVDEDGKWIVLGWKGRVLHAISCWQPSHC